MTIKTLFPTVILLAAAGAATAPAHAAGIVYAYLSAPNQQTVPTTIPSATTETFDETNMTTGNHTNFSSAVGTYTGTFDVIANDQYGNGTGQYFDIGAQAQSAAPVTLTFATPVTYFGLSYDAGDANNGFTFYDAKGNLIGRYSTQTLINALSGGQGTVMDISGNSYAASRYYGQPNGAGTTDTTTRTTDGAEPFSFVNFFAGTGTTIGSVVFDNSGSTGTGFESDNHTISTAVTGRPTSGAFVPVGSTAGAPESSSLALLLGALPLMGAAVRRRRRG